MNNLKISIRLAEYSDLAEMQKMFVDTITTICTSDYNEQQIKAWVSGVENKERWNKIMTKQVVLIAQDAEKIVGFITLANGSHIDLLYVHKNYQRKGIANRLLDEIINQARRLRQTNLTSDVSKTAKAFFLRNGFKQLQEQTNIRQEIELVNYKMSKRL
jgi:putative acetyltransferase